jgi:hypothetical protein
LVAITKSSWIEKCEVPPLIHWTPLGMPMVVFVKGLSVSLLNQIWVIFEKLRSFSNCILEWPRYFGGRKVNYIPDRKRKKVGTPLQQKDSRELFWA